MQFEYWNHDRVMAAIERIKQAKAERLGEPLTLEQRDKLLKSASRTAAAIEASKIAAGMPPSEPAPWPQSTWDFMRRYARKFHPPKVDFSSLADG